MIEIFAIGGYQNIGRNMTAIRYNDEIVIIDMGLDLEKYIELTDEGEDQNISVRILKENGAIPDDSILKEVRENVLAIIPTHAHLDHLGAIPYLAKKYENAKIICTPFSAAVLNRISEDDGKRIHNDIQVLNPGKTYKLSKSIKLEFIAITHSTPDTVVVIIHTPEGKIAYANDFKFDENPLLGHVTDTKRLSEIQEVRLLIMDSLYSDREGKTPSETDVVKKLEKIFKKEKTKDNIIIATTFSSHISRLNTLIKFARSIGRIPIFLGRSLSKYAYAAKDAKVIDFTRDCEIIKYSSKVRKTLSRIKREGLNKYFIICTGHQAEPKATLSRIVKENMLTLKKEDIVIFSSSLIPGETSLANFVELEKELKATGATVYKDIHVSGHASREDHKQLIRLLNPEAIIPAHADKERSIAMKQLCENLGNYKVFLLKEGDRLNI